MIEELKKIIQGEVAVDEKTLGEYSADASIFQVRPQAVVFPKDGEDVAALVKFVNEHKAEIPPLSLTGRSAGTDMSGGPLNESIIVGFTKYMNKVLGFEGDRVRVQPGMYYRDFEKEAEVKDLLLPSYPASKDLAALGGLINNNSGGELTLRWGKTNRYVEELKVVLSDGNEYTLRKLSKSELNEKRRQENFEGTIYRRVHDILEENYDLIQGARPNVTKNSAGYALWDVYNRDVFDLTQLFVGAQGTLGLVTEATLRLVTPPKHRRLAVLFLKDWKRVPELVNKVLPLEPESMEAFDDATMKLAIRFFPEIARRTEGHNLFSLAWQFIPEFFIGLRMLGLPKLVMLVEIAEKDEAEADRKLEELHGAMKKLKVIHRLVPTEQAAEKYWIIRRESFALLRNHVSGKRTAPFVDDFIVRPEFLPDVLPKILAVLKQYKIGATMAGHAGDGNFHIIPLMDLSKKSEQEKIPVVSGLVYDIVLAHEGSITAEHNDGIIRTPYLEKMYGEEVYNIFKEIKDIFDPQNIFNPGKKVGGTMEYAVKHINHE